MALPDYFKREFGTAKTWKASGGTGVITCTSLANGSAQEGAKIDLGANWARAWLVTFETKLASAGTDGSEIELYTNQSISGTPGTSENGGATGADAAFSNAATLKHQWTPVGSIAVAAAASTGVQRQSFEFTPSARYQSPLVVNNSGQAFSGSAGDTIITWTPLEESMNDTV